RLHRSAQHREAVRRDDRPRSARRYGSRRAPSTADRYSRCYARSVSRYDELVATLRIEIPGFRVVRKDRSRLHRAIHYALCVVTLGRMRAYLDSYQTTIGRTVYVTADWDDRDETDRYVTLRHEAVHLRQFRTYTLPGMALLYVLLPLPMGLAWFRAHFEKQAYAESIRAAAEVWARRFLARTTTGATSSISSPARRTAGCGHFEPASSDGTMACWPRSTGSDNVRGRVSDPIVGIDLGTSNTVVAHADAQGGVRVLADESGYKIHPSVVSFHPNGGVVVGAAAKQRKVIDPQNTVYSVKRLIGRAYNSPEVQTAKTRSPFQIKEGANQLPMIATR